MVKGRGITTKSRVTDMIVRQNTELPLDYKCDVSTDETKHPCEWQPYFYEKEGGHERRCTAVTTWGSGASHGAGDKAPPPQG